MSESITERILRHVGSQEYRPLKPRLLARELNLHDESYYSGFREALKELMHAGRVVRGAGGSVMIPSQTEHSDQFVGTYRHNRRGFGFVVPTDPTSREDLFIPEGENLGALSGDIVKAKIVNREQRDGKVLYRGRIVEIVERGQKRFVGSLVKTAGQWMVQPDGNTLTEVILVPDAGSRHLKVGVKVVVELTSYPEKGERPQGVITEVLGDIGERDVDLKSVIVQYNLAGEFNETVKQQARLAVDSFDPAKETAQREDLSNLVICTIDPDDAKDYDDAISLERLPSGHWELGVHIADVSYFVKPGTALDEEARTRGNSSYFPGHVIPMLPEILSNGVCSLQEGVPRVCKSAFITYDEDAHPTSSRFANTVIRSARRLRYTEAQALIDGAAEIPHPDGAKSIKDYDPELLQHLHNMNELARRLQKRRLLQGQLVLDLPAMDLVLDDEGKVINAVPEDQSFTHTLIEMFMVEANEAVARLLDGYHVPFLRRIHPEPDTQDGERIKHFAQVMGYKLSKIVDRKALQQLLSAAAGKPESFAVNMAVLKSLARAEYSPQVIGHYALASTHYCHFTSPIRRYSDLTIHRLLDAYFEARENSERLKGSRRGKLEFDNIPSETDLIELGRHLSFTERRSEDAERELRQVKILTLLKNHIGEEFPGVVSGIANFGIFIQLNTWLIDGVIRYEDLLDDWWDVDTRSGVVRGQRTGKKIAIGDVVHVIIVNVDLARRELNLAVRKHIGKIGVAAALHPTETSRQNDKSKKKKPGQHRRSQRGGGSKRNRRR